MTRTDVLKGVYVVRAVGIVGFGLAAGVAIRNGAAVAAGVCAAGFLAMALSGRIQAFFWTDLLSGLHHMNARDYCASKAHSERFLARLGRHPWLAHLIWLGPSSYSLSAEAMALNNLGAAELALGELEAARIHLQQAIARDPKGPLPYRNMGVLLRNTDSPETARTWFEQAAALGLRGDWSDRAAQASQRNNAELSTTGTVTPRPPG